MKYYNIKDIEVYRTGKVHFIRGKIMKPLTIQENKLKEEMKERCLAKGQYIDKNSNAKFKMLCHLEEFEVQYWELEQQCKKQKEKIDRAIEYINKYESIRAYYEYIDEDGYEEYNCDEDFKKELLRILKKEDN